MAITSIVDEIDAYLLRLREARELLLSPMTEPRSKRTARPKGKSRIAAMVREVSGSRRVHANKSRAEDLAVLGKNAKKRVDATALPSTPSPQPTEDPDQPQIVAAVPEPQRILKSPRPLPKGRSSSIGSGHPGTAKPAIAKHVGGSKPAIALAGIKDSKVVVVSAEQLRRERDRAAHSEVQPQRVPSAGLTGRLAFEALFRDSTDPSKASGS
jgi:hypothetical protein